MLMSLPYQSAGWLIRIPFTIIDSKGQMWYPLTK